MRSHTRTYIHRRERENVASRNLYPLAREDESAQCARRERGTDKQSFGSIGGANHGDAPIKMTGKFSRDGEERSECMGARYWSFARSISHGRSCAPCVIGIESRSLREVFSRCPGKVCRGRVRGMGKQTYVVIDVMECDEIVWI